MMLAMVFVTLAVFTLRLHHVFKVNTAKKLTVNYLISLGMGAY